MPPARALTATLATSLLAALATAAPAAAGTSDPRYRVPVTAATPATIGEFVESESSGDAGVGLRAAFGAPTSTVRRSSQCFVRWSRIGLWVELTNYGQSRHPCTHGYFQRARLLGSRWYTPRGLRVGSSTAAARSQAVCGAGRPSCRRPGYALGYVLGFHRIDCARGLFPNVIAAVARGRVTALWVYTHGCE
ncbi:MAG TPA: hypothetical protein VNB64_04070 [Solirubrobacteraceae bacterium]|nr:hypothetical protein [Solirubrobacteraceae bacterium]